MYKLIMITSMALVTLGSTAIADEKYNHFPSIESTDFKTAFCNIERYNEKMITITNKPVLTSLDMLKIHELTYTLENAINFIKVSLENVSQNLEDVHKASERLDQKTIHASGEKYLKATKRLLENKKCE
jgi:hypothetical protein